MNYSRQEAHELIDLLPESQVFALVGLLETMVDPVIAALRNAPLDDEEETEEEKVAVAKARASLNRNGGTPHAEAMQRLGLD
jgi:hypothetical protein